ncbi:MAG: hypothetical protein ACOWWR_18500 [Eubacteriales bacterium]
MSILANLDDLVEDVRDLIDEETADFWTDAFIERQLKKAHQISSTKLKTIKAIWTTVLTASITPGTGESTICNNREITLPGAFIGIDKGGVYYNDKALSHIDIPELKTNDTEWLDETGTPHGYYLRGNVLGFDRQVSAGDVVKIHGIKMPTELSADQSPWDGDYRTIGYRFLLVDYAVGMCWRKKNEMTKYREILTPQVGSFWQDLNDMRVELLTNNLDDQARMIPASNPAHHVKSFNFPDMTQFDH